MIAGLFGSASNAFVIPATFEPTNSVWVAFNWSAGTVVGSDTLIPLSCNIFLNISSVSTSPFLSFCILSASEPGVGVPLNWGICSLGIPLLPLQYKFVPGIVISHKLKLGAFSPFAFASADFLAKSSIFIETSLRCLTETFPISDLSLTLKFGISFLTLSVGTVCTCDGLGGCGFSWACAGLVNGFSNGFCVLFVLFVPFWLFAPGVGFAPTLLLAPVIGPPAFLFCGCWFAAGLCCWFGGTCAPLLPTNAIAALYDGWFLS